MFDDSSAVAVKPEQAAETALEQPAEITAVRRYLAARDEVARAEERTREAKVHLERCEAEVLALYERHGISQVKVDGRLVFLTRTLRASTRAGMEEALIAQLHEHGYEELVRERVSAQTLSAWIRERDRDEEPIPDVILQFVNVAEMFGLSMKKG